MRWQDLLAKLRALVAPAAVPEPIPTLVREASSASGIVSRRAFLGLAGASVAALAIDPEQVVWIPGQRTIFLPAAPELFAEGLFEGEVLRERPIDPRALRDPKSDPRLAQAIIEARMGGLAAMMKRDGITVVAPLELPMAVMRTARWTDAQGVSVRGIEEYNITRDTVPIRLDVLGCNA